MAADTKKKRNTYNVDESLESPFNIKHLKRSFVYLKNHRRSLLAAFSCSVIAILCTLSTPYLLMIMIDDCIAAKNIKGLIIFGVINIIIMVMRAFCERQRSIISAKTGQRIVSEIRSDLFSHLQKLPFDYFDSRPHGKILVRVVNYVNTISDFFANGLVNIVLELLSLLFIMFFMFTTHATLTWIVLIGVLPIIAYLIISKKAQRRASILFSNKTSNLNAYYQESIDGMMVTQSFDREDKNIEIADDMADACRKTHITLASRVYLMFVVVSIVSAVVTVLLYVFGIKIPGITVGVIIAMTSYSERFWTPIENLGNLYNSILNTVSYLERIFEVMDEKCEIEDAPDSIELPELSGKVDFEDVTFEYDEGMSVLEHFDLHVADGQSIALVGPTGAGKTTVVNLLARFYDIKSGKITIDGYDITKAKIRSLRSQMGMMLQDTFIFAGTVMENIRYGDLSATDEDVINAAKTVHAHEFIMNLPDGYNTYINEHGGTLSAGQRQLISFARTILSNPRVLILDEATSAIDTKTELLVQQGLNSLLKDRTSFIIAHRLSTIKNCDKIAYITQKRIMEFGSHDELMNKKGYYYELYTSQLS